MSQRPPLQTRLIDAADSVLVVVDMQDSFFTKYESAKSRAVVARAAWLIRAAAGIGVPIIAMGENISALGGLNADIAAALPEGTHVFDKDVFGCADQPDIAAAIDATGRRTAIVIGVETDVCVAHSALSLMRRGMDVSVVRDATLTTAADEDIGLMRIRDAGGVITSVKSLYYEWQRSVSGCAAHNAADPDLRGAALPAVLNL